MERHGIEWEQKGTHEEHLSVLDLKKRERSKEVAAQKSKAGAGPARPTEREGGRGRARQRPPQQPRRRGGGADPEAGPQVEQPAPHLGGAGKPVSAVLSAAGGMGAGSSHV